MNDLNQLGIDVSASVQPESYTGKQADEAVGRYVLDAYKKLYPADRVNHLHVYPKTQEGLVAEINHQYIVKIPYAKRGIAGIRIEKKITDCVRELTPLAVPDITLFDGGQPLARYLKIPGSNFDKKWFTAQSDDKKQQLASQLADFLVVLHRVGKEQKDVSALSFSPSWELSPSLIKQQLSDKTDMAITSTLASVLVNHEKLNVPDSSMVVGHFDIHGGNVLVDKNTGSITGIIDFGNCKVGDIHQEFSVMNLSSPDLAKRMLLIYQQKTGRSLNPVLIQHYTTIFYLHLLATLDAKNKVALYQQWLVSFTEWYQYLVDERANDKLAKQTQLTLMTDSARQWLASQMMRGVSSSAIHLQLRQQGYSDIEIRAEIKLAQQHPYIKAGKNIAHVLDKRNWLLETNNAIASLDERYCTKIEVRETPAVEVFIRDYYSKQLPVVFTDGISHWPALNKWTPGYFAGQCGDAEIEVQFGRESDPLYERNARQLKRTMTMREYTELVMQGGDSNDYYMTARNTKNSKRGIEKLFEDVGDFGPVDNGGNGYRDANTIKESNLLWFGPKGTVTPIHHDLTNNMLVQIYGRKKVTLIPSFQVPNMYNDKSVYSQVDYPNHDEDKFPLMKNVHAMEVVLNPGDAIFIPIAWWHRVESLDVSVSLTFTDFIEANWYPRAPMNK